MITLIGLGCGGPGGLTADSLRALGEAELILGANRLLEAVPPCAAEMIPEYRPAAILEHLRQRPDRRACVVYSGDTGFYSGASGLAALLEREGLAFEILPGLSSVQVFAARLGLPWQDWRLCSAHGVDCDPAAEIRAGGYTFFLTGGRTTPADLCRRLTEAGLGELPAAAGEELSYPGERIRRGTAAELAGQSFAPLSVLLVRGPERGRSPVPASRGGKRRLMISAMSSGSGKTVLTCGLLAALRRRGVGCEAFKCGPDYIDPMFHARVLGVPSRNLDLFLQGRAGVRRALGTQREPFALIEGAMGFYDGVAGTAEASAWDTARTGDIPVVLAVRPRGSSLTLAAQVRGTASFRDPGLIVGLILTDCRRSLFERLRPILERETGLPVLGYLPPMEEAALESRHLGLVTAGEVEDLRARFDAVALQLERTVDLDRLLSLAGAAEEISDPVKTPERSCAIAVARDEAFCFLYQDSLDALERAGAELRFFSPLRDGALPPCGGLYLCGGYPELYARALSENVSMRESIAAAVRGGLPTLAECGGFLYLQRTLEDGTGTAYPMAGVLPGAGFRTERLQRFGYGRLRAERDSLLFRAGEQIPFHEFHYWDCTVNGGDLAAEKPDGRSWRCGYVTDTLYAAFPHLHLGGELPLAERFAAAARKKEETP